MKKVVVFVLGMGRSGTSLLARVLALSGGVLPARLVGGIPSNPRGHWEPEEALELNESFLREASSSWFDPTPLGLDRLDTGRPQVSAYLSAIRALLRGWPASPFLVIKEPRITSVIPIWFQAAYAEGFDIRVVIPFRHPDEVAMSLAARDGLTRGHSDLLWLKNCLLAEQATRDLPRAFVDHRLLITDWRCQVNRIGRLLKLDLSGANAEAIDAFVTPTLHRQRRIVDGTLRGRLSALATVTDAFTAAAHAETPVDSEVFDEIRSDFYANSAAWPAAMAAFRQRFQSPETAALADQQREQTLIITQDG